MALRAGQPLGNAECVEALERTLHRTLAPLKAVREFSRYRSTFGQPPILPKQQPERKRAG